MLGARLVSVQKLLGHSDPKITERRYGHLLPDFMKSEVDRLRFGLDRLVPRGGGEHHPGAANLAGDGRNLPGLAAVSSELGIRLVSTGPRPKGKAGTPPVSRGVPASLLAGRRGLEPLASGVTVGEVTLGDGGQASQPVGNAGSEASPSGPGWSGFAALPRPFGKQDQDAGIEVARQRMTQVR